MYGTVFNDTHTLPVPCPISSVSFAVRVLARNGYGARRARTTEVTLDGRLLRLAGLSSAEHENIRREIERKNSLAVNGCLAAGSLKTYATAWSSWLRCADFYCMDPRFLDPTGNMMSVQQCIHMLRLYVGFECGLRHISPVSIRTTYLPGIAKTLEIMGVFNNFRVAVNHMVFKLLLDGYTRQWEKIHPASSRTKIPYTLNFVSECGRLMANGSLQIHGHPTYGQSPAASMNRLRVEASQAFGVCYLMRKSEFLPTTETPNGHGVAMRRSHLRFQDINQQEIPYHLVGKVEAFWLGVSVEFSKADQAGHGRVLVHAKQEDGSTPCIVTQMQSYIGASRDLYGATQEDMLFYVPSLPKYTTDVFTAFMKATCTLIGIPAERISAHSVRYGGATTLAAAGFPDYVIAYYGGWTPDSTAMRRYIRPTNDMVRMVSKQMSRSQHGMPVQSVVNQLKAYITPGHQQHKPKHGHRTRT